MCVCGSFTLSKHSTSEKITNVHMCILLWSYLTYPLKENVIWKEKNLKEKIKKEKKKVEVTMAWNL